MSGSQSRGREGRSATDQHAETKFAAITERICLVLHLSGPRGNIRVDRVPAEGGDGVWRRTKYTSVRVVRDEDVSSMHTAVQLRA